MKMKSIIIGVSILFITFFTFGQVDRSKAPESGPAPEIQIPDPVVFDLDNGMKVILSTNTSIPKVSFNLVMGSDSRLEGRKAGLSDLLGDLIMSGTTNRTKDKLDIETDYIGAYLSASNSNIYLSVLTKHMDKGLDLMTDIMQNASFPESEFDRIKKKYESGLFSIQSDASSMMSNAMHKVIFTDKHPYGEIMTEETLNNITRQDVIDLYKEQFTPKGSYLVIVGDIDKDQAKKIAEAKFGSWKGGEPFKRSYNSGVTPGKNQVIFVEKPGAVQSVISVAFPIQMKPGDQNQIQLTVANNLYGGGGFGTRLMQNLREDKAYTYGAYSRLDVDREGSFLYASGNFRNDVTDSAIVEFLSEINKISEGLATEDELSLTKASMSGGFARSLESPRTVASFALNTFRNNLPEDYYKTYLQKVKAVSDQDVLEMSKKYFKPNNLYIIVVGSKDVLEKIKQFDSDGKIQILDAFGNPVKEKKYQPSTLSKTDVLEKYLMAVTKTSSMSAAEKKINKIKSLEEEITVKVDQAGMEMLLTKYFMAPNMNYTKLEFSGMVVQEEIFNGEKGTTKTMNQSMQLDSEEYTDEEVINKKKTSAVFSEYSLLCNLDEVNLLGIEVREGIDSMYVIQYEIGGITTTAYYNSTTFLKTYSKTIDTSGDEEPQIMTSNYSEYTDYNGYLFPSNTSQMVGPNGMTGTIKKLKINGSIDKDVFEVK